MADEDWQAPPPLTDGPQSAFLARLRSAPQQFDFFQAVRVLEATYCGHTALGETRRARNEPVRLTQIPHLAFPPAQVAALEQQGGRLKLSTFVMGLFGPHGPLPLHITVHARDRQRLSGDPTFAHFCDVFHHRMLSLFYRTWARARPTVAADRPEQNRFRTYLGALSGLASPPFFDRQPLPDRFVLYGAGLFGMTTRPPEAVGRLLTAFFKVPIAIEEFVGAWLAIPERQQSRLGIGKLGEDAVLGAMSFQRHQRFRIQIGPLSLRAFRRFLPGGGARRNLMALVSMAAGTELDWDARLWLRAAEVPKLRLDGSSQLGWISWLHIEVRTRDAGDLILEGC